MNEEKIFNLEKIEIEISFLKDNFLKNKDNILLDISNEYYEIIKKNRKNLKWKDNILLCIEGLKKSKDLYLFCWFLESLSYEFFFLGFYKGINFLFFFYNFFENFLPKNIDLNSNLNWIDDNFNNWFLDLEILPEILLKNLHEEIFIKIFDFNKKYLVSKKYINEKMEIIENILNSLEENKKKFFFKNMFFFFKKIKIFYENILENLNKQENNKNIEKFKEEISFKENIFYQIKNLVEEGLKNDKNDLLLFLIFKIIELKTKSNKEILQIFQKNTILDILN